MIRETSKTDQRSVAPARASGWAPGQFLVALLGMAVVVTLLWLGFLYLRDSKTASVVNAVVAIIWGVGGIAALFGVTNLLIESLPTTWRARVLPFMFFMPGVGILFMFLTIPTLLTWARIVAIPLIVVVFYLPLDAGMRNLVATVMFVFFALTDWLDGWLARKLNQTSAFGAFLDPVADKLLICAALVVLLRLDRVDALVALVIIGREIAISALREWMAQIGASRSVAVHMLGKLKTTAQMIAIPFLLFDSALFGVIDTRIWGTMLMYVAAVLTVWSMVYYLRKAIPEIRAKVS